MYDNLNRETQELWLDQNLNVINTITWQYDAAGQLLSASDADSSESYTYDGLGQVVTDSNAGTPGSPTVVWTSTYDPAGRLVIRAETINGQAGATTDFSVDNLGRVYSEEQFGGGAVFKRVDFAYNALGQTTQVGYYVDPSLINWSAPCANPLVAVTYSYDDANQLTGLTYQHGTTTLAAYTWSYNDANQVTSETSSDGTTAFQYDAAGELTSVSNPNQNYSYDATGNRTTAGSQTGPYNRLLSDGTYTYTYDNDGNVTSRTDIATGATDEYTWDYRNRLTQVVSKDSSGNVIQVVTYTYDVNDERIGKQVQYSDGQPDLVERYVYAGGQLALVFNGAGQLQEQYLYGPGVDQVLAVDRGGTVQWLLGDDQGTIRDVVNASGALIDHLVVDPFGVVVSQTNPAAQPRFIYTGQEYDPETGLYQDRARYYDPADGRFISDDPTGFAAGDPNLYRYVGNAAPNATDPSGLKPATPTMRSATYARDTAFAQLGYTGTPGDFNKLLDGESPQQYADRMVNYQRIVHEIEGVRQTEAVYESTRRFYLQVAAYDLVQGPTLLRSSRLSMRRYKPRTGPTTV